jgi:hypothetical protein
MPSPGVPSEKATIASYAGQPAGIESAYATPIENNVTRRINPIENPIRIDFVTPPARNTKKPFPTTSRNKQTAAEMTSEANVESALSQPSNEPFRVMVCDVG